MATAGATDGQTQEAKGGVKFELVGIPDVMLEENKKEKKKPDTNPGVLVFDMGTDVKAPAKKPALSSVKKGQGVARQGGSSARKSEATSASKNTETTQAS